MKTAIICEIVGLVTGEVHIQFISLLLFKIIVSSAAIVWLSCAQNSVNEYFQSEDTRQQQQRTVTVLCTNRKHRENTFNIFSRDSLNVSAMRSEECHCGLKITHNSKHRIYKYILFIGRHDIKKFS
ncbi:Hypothetical predicted protein [Octopus vulgaris]|uniref:Uncharacterized protein n=1 Tax=Octopus vulgaris TaxID=6645 RepID=A0AA36B0Y0_OCTVU|nr:Hypothetical predicted protein [Octopus vulgaris]